jgi:anti-anti-sigma regulatory factor
MNISVKQAQTPVPVTILYLEGDLDASNYLDVVDKAREIYASGSQNILIDMSKVPFMASSGLVALHSIALILRGEQLPDLQFGWNAFHNLERDRENGYQEHIKIYNPPPKVTRTLEMTGMLRFFETYSNLQTAIDSFGKM